MPLISHTKIDSRNPDLMPVRPKHPNKAHLSCVPGTCCCAILRTPSGAATAPLAAQVILIPVLLPTVIFHVAVLNLFARPWTVISLHVGGLFWLPLSLSLSL